MQNFIQNQNIHVGSRNDQKKYRNGCDLVKVTQISPDVFQKKFCRGSFTISKNWNPFLKVQFRSKICCDSTSLRQGSIRTNWRKTNLKIKIQKKRRQVTLTKEKTALTYGSDVRKTFKNFHPIQCRN